MQVNCGCSVLSFFLEHGTKVEQVQHNMGSACSAQPPNVTVVILYQEYKRVTYHHCQFTFLLNMQQIFSWLQPTKQRPHQCWCFSSVMLSRVFWPGKGCEMIWFFTTMWGIWDLIWTASLDSWAKISLQSKTFWAASSFTCHGWVPGQRRRKI